MSRSLEPLEALFGRGRPRMLSGLDAPATTLELAQLLGVSTGGVSEHLGVLRRAGLVTQWLEGRRFVYSRSIKGERARLFESKQARALSLGASAGGRCAVSGRRG